VANILFLVNMLLLVNYFSDNIFPEIIIFLTSFLSFSWPCFFFQDQLTALIKTMQQTSPRFVRCIKSNTEKLPLSFEAPNVLRQLKYAGVMEALRVRRAGYPNRLRYRAFLLQFRLMLG